MDTNLFNRLSHKEKSLICLAVLLDGFEAGVFLASDNLKGDILSSLAAQMADLDPELRMPLAGTLLRRASANKK